MLCVSEHGRIFLADQDKSQPDGSLLLREKKFRALMSLLEDVDEGSADYSPVLTYARPSGREQLKVQNYVGVIRIDDGTQIEVLPKISKSLDSQAARDLLVRMLVELEDSPFFEGNAADLQTYQMPIFEVLMRCFLDQVATIVRKGIARAYVEHRDNLVFLRGKLQLAENLRKNAFTAGRLYCEFDEYEANRPVNRLIKAALQVVRREARDPENQQRCRELLFCFDAVPSSHNQRVDFQRMRQDRLVQHYAPAMPLCKLILSGLNPLTQQGESHVVSMLFPMEQVFENFVAAKLPKQLATWRVRSQVSNNSLVVNHLDKSMFGLRPDLLFARGENRVIGDTKWKLVNQYDRQNRYGISQQDIYQLFAYAEKLLGGQDFREVLLIYPATDAFKEPLAPFWYRAHSEVLWVVPYDLSTETLILPGESQLSSNNDQVMMSG